MVGGDAALTVAAAMDDGGPFPQVIEAKLKTFFLQVERVHGTMQRLEDEIAV